MTPPGALLLSSSRVLGGEMLEYALGAIQEFLGTRERLVVVPFAGRDHDDYLEGITIALAPLSLSITGVHRAADPVAALDEAEAVYVPGGNTFRLLRALEQRGLLEAIRAGVSRGSLVYLGASAGANLACPTIRTTNDMPIVEPRSLAALGLVPFQINPHYVDADPGSMHMGETREQRIHEFLDENDVPVLGLREGAWVERQGNAARLGGKPGAMLFKRDADPRPLEPGTDLSWLLATSAPGAGFR